MSGETEAAIRLLERVLEMYPRAFDVVLGDAHHAGQGRVPHGGAAQLQPHSPTGWHAKPWAWAT